MTLPDLLSCTIRSVETCATDLLALLDLHDGIVGEDLAQVLHLLPLEAIDITQRRLHNQPENGKKGQLQRSAHYSDRSSVCGGTSVCVCVCKRVCVCVGKSVCAHVQVCMCV